MRYFYDLEFLERPGRIDLISIGIVADDGREYYAVNSDMPLDDIKAHHWLMDNVWPHLPLRDIHPAMNEPPGPFRDDVPMGGRCKCKPQDGHLDTSSILVKPRWVIANEVRQFLTEDEDKIELWAYYGAYDHVCLMWLWGPMISKPARIPMWTHDLKQLAEQVGIDGETRTLPDKHIGGPAHNALADARWVAAAVNHCEQLPDR
jgi:hypothetical protein